MCGGRRMSAKERKRIANEICTLRNDGEKAMDPLYSVYVERFGFWIQITPKIHEFWQKGNKQITLRSFYGEAISSRKTP
jgi:hypothetical protein